MNNWRNDCTSSLEAAKEIPAADVPFQLLKPGSLHPRGWLERYIRRIADGWTLHFAVKEEPWLFTVLWDRFTSEFPEPVEDQEAPDYCAYFADGFIRLAHMLPDTALNTVFQTWLEKVLNSQDPDGYLGALDPPGRWHNWLEIFHQSILIEVLLYHHAYTGDIEFLERAERAARQPMDHWESSGVMRQRLYGGHGVVVIRPMLKLYELTGRKAYLDFARTVLDTYGKTGHYLAGGDVGMQHNACESEHVGFPALLYEHTGETRYLAASLAAWERMQPYISIDGSPHGNEQTFRSRPRGNSEHCGAVEWAATNEHLLRITGDVRFADAAERAIYNAYPSAKSPDCMTLAYMHSPNQLIATEWSGPQFDDPDYCDSKQYFSSAHSPLCCNVNSPRAMPTFVDHMIFRAGNGLAVALYGPCSGTAALPGAGSVTLVQKTAYPFDDVIHITVDPEREASFPLHLRIPAWCSGASLEINGKSGDKELIPGTFAVLDRTWRPGDVVRLSFQTPVRLEIYPEGYVRAGGVSVIRGPLTFTLPVPEVWTVFDSVHNAPLSECASSRVMPGKDAAWNYALLVDQDDPDKDVQLVTLDAGDNGNPWETAVIGLRVRARRVLNWAQEGNESHPMTPGLPFKPVCLADRIETITLVPFGSTRLRMTFLPLVGGVRGGKPLPATLITPVAPEYEGGGGDN